MRGFPIPVMIILLSGCMAGHGAEGDGAMAQDTTDRSLPVDVAADEGGHVYVLDPATMEYENELLAFELVADSRIVVDAHVALNVPYMNDGDDDCVMAYVSAPTASPASADDRTSSQQAPAPPVAHFGALAWGTSKYFLHASAHAAGTSFGQALPVYESQSDFEVAYDRAEAWELEAGERVTVIVGGHSPALAGQPFRFSDRDASVRVTLNVTGSSHIEAGAPMPVRCGNGMRQADVQGAQVSVYLTSAAMDARVLMETDNGGTVTIVNRFAEFLPTVGTVFVGGNEFPANAALVFRTGPEPGKTGFDVERWAELSYDFPHWFVADAHLPGLKVLEP